MEELKEYDNKDIQKNAIYLLDNELSVYLINITLPFVRDIIAAF